MGALTLFIVTVLSVHDGDTLTVNLPCAIPAVCSRMPVRIDGIDTPELNDKRPEMKLLAQKARLRLKELTSPPHQVEMQVTGRDKYFRLDARIVSDGIPVARTLTAEGLARPYTGSGPRPW